MCATVMEVDLLGSRETDLPSMDDWLTRGASARRTSAGMLVHDVLTQAFSASLPNWNRMMPEARADGDERTDDGRFLRI